MHDRARHTVLWTCLALVSAALLMVGFGERQKYRLAPVLAGQLAVCGRSAAAAAARGCLSLPGI